MKYKTTLSIFSGISLIASLAIGINIAGKKEVLAQQIGFTRAVRLQTKFTGENKCLDIINDGTNNQLIMADCGNYTGQFWSIERLRIKGFIG